MAPMTVRRLLTRSAVITALRRCAALSLAVGILYGLAVVVYSTQVIFKVKNHYAIVLERFGGEREAVTRLGWHARLPFFTRIEKVVPLMNQSLMLGGGEEPMRIISKENVALWTSSVLTYRIHDLKTWAIENLDPLALLQGDYDGIVKDILQAQEVNQLVSAREEIKEKIFMALKSRPINAGGPTLEEKYGIDIVSFVLKETRFGDKLVTATEEKKRRELIAEADNYAADQEASRIRKLYAAYLDSIKALQESLGGPDGSKDAALLAFLAQQKWATAYEKNQAGQSTVIIQNTSDAPSMALVPPGHNGSSGRKPSPGGP